jgi:hypothetical protein
MFSLETIFNSAPAFISARNRRQAVLLRRVDRQSAAATALWIVPGRLWKHWPHPLHVRRIQSGVALRFPPRSKTLARATTGWPNEMKGS